MVKNAVLASVTLFATAALYADYTPEKWNLEAREKFADQRFGIFIHLQISFIPRGQIQFSVFLHRCHPKRQHIPDFCGGRKFSLRDHA